MTDLKKKDKIGQVDAANKANATSIRGYEGGGKQVAHKIDIYLVKLEFKGGPISADGAVREGTHSATIQTHVRACLLSPTRTHPRPIPEADLLGPRRKELHTLEPC